MRALKPLFLTTILLATILQLPLAIGDPGWLSGWDYRVEITIDSDDIDAGLSNFPILVYLSGSSGINGEDVTFIFDEVGANYLKIAVTSSDGITELYVEVERWNAVAEEAWLWVKIPSISYVADTVIYLYYDNGHADNNARVGVVGSAPGEMVWTPSYLSVLHLSEEAGDFMDSTLWDNDASAQGTVNRGDQKIDGGIDLPGTNDYARIDTAGIIDGLDEATLEAWVYLDVLGDNRALISDWGAGDDTSILYYDVANNKFRVLFRNTELSVPDCFFGSLGPSGAWYHVAGVYKRNDRVYGYENGVETIGDVSSDFPITSPNNLYYIGINRDLGFDLNGKMDEVRISSSARSGSWLKATYESGRDHLLDYGIEEEFIALESPAYLFGAGFNASSPYVSLYWKSNLTGITLFEVQNSTDKISWDYLGSNTTREYHDFQVVNGTERYYRVRACNFTGAVWDNSTWTDINFEKVYFLSTGAPAPEPAVLAMGKYYAMSIILLILGVLIGIGMRRKR